MVDTEKVLWCVKNGVLRDLEDQLEKVKLHVDDTALTNGRPAIVCAADYGQHEIVEFLIKKGSNVNIEDNHGITPLLAAIWEGHTKTVDLLLRNKANKNLLSPDKKSYEEEAECAEIKKLLTKY